MADFDCIAAVTRAGNAPRLQPPANKKRIDLAPTQMQQPIHLAYIDTPASDA
jgi:hypothetical protein